MKTRNDCEIACDCVKRANVVLHVDLCKEIFDRKHTGTHKPTSAQPTHCATMTRTHIHTYTHTPINRLWSPLAYGLGGNNVYFQCELLHDEKRNVSVPQAGSVTSPCRSRHTKEDAGHH